MQKGLQSSVENIVFYNASLDQWTILSQKRYLSHPKQTSSYDLDLQSEMMKQMMQVLLLSDDEHVVSMF